jgi:hypothetical protein
MEDAGRLWPITDVVGVIMLGGALAYGAYQWRRAPAIRRSSGTRMQRRGISIIPRRAVKKSPPGDDSGADYGIVSNMYGVVTSACVPFL